MTNILLRALFVPLSSEGVIAAEATRWLHRPFFGILIRRRSPSWASRTLYHLDWCLTLLEDRSRFLGSCAPVEGEGHGQSDASHTRPWHHYSAAVGVLCPAVV